MAFDNHPAFIPPDRLQSLWRFMDFPSFFYLVQKRSLYFSSLEMLTNDPWEGLPPAKYFDPLREISVFNLNTQESEIKTQLDYFGSSEEMSRMKKVLLDLYRAQRRTTFVNCWHMSDIESEALWRIYGAGGYGIAIKSNYERFDRSVQHTAPVYAGVVRYIDENTESLEEKVQSITCLWKRRSFLHEREFRAVILGRQQSLGVDVKVDINTLIEKIFVDPRSKSWFLDITRDLARSAGCSAEVQRSMLLDNPYP